MSLRFTVPTTAIGDALFDDMPPEVREVMKLGFSRLATLPPQSLSLVARHLVRGLDPSEPAPESGDFARKSQIDAATGNAVMAAAALLASASVAGTRPMPLHVFINKATDSGILKEEHASLVQAFADNQLEPHSVALGDALARASSSTRIVPSFHSLNTTIDLRVAAVDGQRLVTIPVVIAMLQTDVESRELLFQMTPRDVEQLLKQLGNVTKSLARYRNMATQLTPGE